MRRAVVTGALLLLLTRGVAAADQPLVFTDPTRQARYTHLLEELRCLVCQNQSLADSHADLAQDLRNEVYAKIAAGHDDADIIAYLVDRYGDFVLYRPPLKASTWALWLGPFILLVVGGIVVIRRARRTLPPASPIAPAEQARLAALLESEELPPQ